MKIVKILLLVLGLVGLVAGGVYLTISLVEIRNTVDVANANKSTPEPSMLGNYALLTAGLGSLGGLLLGVGLGLPSRLAGSIRRDAVAGSHALHEADGGAPAAASTLTVDERRA